MAAFFENIECPDARTSSRELKWSARKSGTPSNVYLFWEFSREIRKPPVLGCHPFCLPCGGSRFSTGWESYWSSDYAAGDNDFRRRATRFASYRLRGQRLRIGLRRFIGSHGCPTHLSQWCLTYHRGSRLDMAQQPHTVIFVPCCLKPSIYVRPRFAAGTGWCFHGALRSAFPFGLGLVTDSAGPQAKANPLQHRLFVTACWACAAWLQRILSAGNVSG